MKSGSTLQTGIGAIPNIVATELAKGPLGGFGVHSEMFTNGLMRLHQAGKVTNDAKGVFDGVSVTTFALGTAELYGWLDGNDDVAFLPVETVNDPTVIARNANLVSINGALSVDLYGQVVADNIGGRQVSGRRRARGLRGRGGAAPRRPLTHLPPFDGSAQWRGRVPDRGAPARGRGGLDATPPHRRHRHRVRRGGADRAHRQRACPPVGRGRRIPTSGTTCARSPTSWAVPDWPRQRPRAQPAGSGAGLFGHSRKVAWCRPISPMMASM